MLSGFGGTLSFPGLPVGGRSLGMREQPRSDIQQKGQGGLASGPASQKVQELLNWSSGGEDVEPSPPRGGLTVRSTGSVSLKAGPVQFKDSSFCMASGVDQFGRSGSRGPGTSVQPFSLQVRERRGEADLVGWSAAQLHRGEGRVEPGAAYPVPARDPGAVNVSRSGATSLAPTSSFQDLGAVGRSRSGASSLAPTSLSTGIGGVGRSGPGASSLAPLSGPLDISGVGRSRTGASSLAPHVSSHPQRDSSLVKLYKSGQRLGEYRRVQSAPPPTMSVRAGKARVGFRSPAKVLDTPRLEESLVLDYDEESPEEGEIRAEGTRGGLFHASDDVLQAPVVVRPRATVSRPTRESGPVVRVPRSGVDVEQMTWRERPAQLPLLNPGSVAGPRSTVMTIWIVGHSFIRRAEDQAIRSYFGSTLGFNSRLFNVVWKGKGGMIWRELIPALNSWLVGGICPDVLLLHLGENDLCGVKGVVLLRAMKKDLSLIRQQWAGCHVLWTELVPRRTWRGAIKPRAVDKARRKLNLEVSRFCRDLGFGRVSHKDIRYDNVEFFRGDGVHLSRIGMDLYLLELREVLSRCLKIQHFLG
ncbi:uncharacterized protein LOC144824466 [Lissotriton helveticus]